MAARRQHEIRRGLIKVRIRQRKSNLKSGYVVSVVRLYRNGSEWKESARFERDDIPLIRLVLDEAYTWILSRGGEVE